MTEPQRELDGRAERKCGPQGNGSPPHDGGAPGARPRHGDRGPCRLPVSLHNRGHAGACRICDDRY